jgi:hypothetical protein
MFEMQENPEGKDSREEMRALISSARACSPDPKTKLLLKAEKGSYRWEHPETIQPLRLEKGLEILNES